MSEHSRAYSMYAQLYNDIADALQKGARATPLQLYRQVRRTTIVFTHDLALTIAVLEALQSCGYATRLRNGRFARAKEML